MHAEIIETDYIDVAGRLTELGITNPSQPAWLPHNIVTAASLMDLHHRDSTVDLNKTLKAAGMELAVIPPKSNGEPTIDLQSDDLWLAALYIPQVASAYLPYVHAVIDVIIAYAQKMRPLSEQCSLEVVVETKGDRTTKRLQYHGPVSAVSKLKAAIEEVIK
jgi:hypothetical protein